MKVHVANFTSRGWAKTNYFYTHSSSNKLVLSARMARRSLAAVFAYAALGQEIPPCSLNGVLVGGSCVCDPGWSGIACHVLDLLPAAPLTAAAQTYFHPSNGGAAGGGYVSNSWGISVARDDSGTLWHGFMTELGGNCSLSSYSAASQILHLTAPSPQGPWMIEGVALGRFAHNPQVVRGGDGSWLLFHIGADEPSGCDAERCPGSHNASCTGGHGTSVARALSPYGPWDRVPYILPDNETNPSALVLADGSIVVTARRWELGVPIYTATSWRGPYVAAPRINVTLVRAGAPATDIYTPFDEDAFLWADSRGGYHMLTHRQPNGTACPQGPNPSQCDCTGGHMYAPSLMGPWFVDLDVVYNCTLRVAGGGLVTLVARQRPTLLLPSRGNGQPSCPILFTGASTDPKSQYYSSFTMQQTLACS